MYDTILYCTCAVLPPTAGWNVYPDVEVAYLSPSQILPVDYAKYVEPLVFNDLNDYKGT
jgi:hypothetical protein